MRHTGIKVDGIVFRELVSVCSDAQFQPAGQNVQKFDTSVFVEPAAAGKLPSRSGGGAHYMLMNGRGLKSLGSAEVERVIALNLLSC